MVKKNMTIDDLAVMVQNGFLETKSEMKEGFARVDERFERVDKRFEVVEKLLLKEQEQEIIDLRHRVEFLENILNVKK